MRVIKVRGMAAVAATVLLVLGVAADASAQTPGAPRVTVNADNSAVLTYAPPVTPPHSAYLLVTFNGGTSPPIGIGQATVLSSNGALRNGNYTVQVVWPSAASDVVGFTVGVGPGTTPPTTILNTPVVTGSTAFVSWDPVPGATSYDIEIFTFSHGTRLLWNTPGTAISAADIPAGNYGVRVRARNFLGYGGFSNQVLVNVNTTFRIRDMEVSLTWNSQADMDLHVIEPNGQHVWWKVRQGFTVVLDRDNTTGFGPEIATVGAAGAVPGIYQVFVVHYRTTVPTTSTVAITLGVGSASPYTKVFTRQTIESDARTGINVALVDIKNGIISEQFGTRPTAAADERPTPKPQ